MAEAQRCPNCDRELPALAPQGLCPACLLGRILATIEEGESPRSEPESTAEARVDPTPKLDRASAVDSAATIPGIAKQSGPPTDVHHDHDQPTMVRWTSQ
jgi:hypothetical protein